MEPVPRGGARGVTTIARVAQEAGVGVGTVSRVINGSTAVSEATRRRVLEVVAELGYEPNATARALSTGRTRAVGVIAPFFTRPSVMERLRGLAPVLVDQAHERLPSVLVDDVEGGRIATHHLLELGHTRIAFAGDTVDEVHGASASYRRCVGYQRALADAGMTPPPELVKVRPHGDDASVIAADLLALDEPPTAVFAASDLQALAMIDAITALGRRVPDDLSVVGFDDVELARYAGLTTVAQPLEVSGTRGAELLLSSLEGTQETE